MGMGLAGAACATEILDGVVAIVNEQIITLSDVREMVRPVEAQLVRDYEGPELRMRLREAQLDALKSLIDRALVLDEFQTRGYNIPNRVFEQQLEEVIAQEFKGDRVAFIKTLESQNITLSQYRQRLRDRTIVQAMRNSKAESQVVVSPYQMEQYYKDNIEAFKVGDRIKLRMIFIKRTANLDAGVADPRRALADEIHGKRAGGETFDALARQYSDGRGAAEGGEWGWTGRGELRKELDEPAFSLKPGEFSPVIETAEGWYIVQVDDFQPAHTKPLSEVRDDIERILQREIRARVQDEWLRNLRADAFIRIRKQ